MKEESKNPQLERVKTRLVRPSGLIGSYLEERYELRELVGGGATSSVYEAYDRELDKKVAIKILHAHLSEFDHVRERFEREARTAAALNHHNVVRILDQGKSDVEMPYFVMEFVEGVPLQELLPAEGGYLPADRAVKIFVQICAALYAAHEKRIVHRDLKPQNIMVSTTDGDDVKVLDFGIAKVMGHQGDTFFKHTQSGDTLGSLLYMSPEQCLDLDVDERSDVYSLGCLMFEVLTGSPPFSSRTAFETMNAQISQQAARFKTVRPDMEVSPRLETIVLKAMEKKPENRFQSVKALLAALQSPDDGKTVFINRDVGTSPEYAAKGANLPTSAQALGQDNAIELCEKMRINIQLVFNITSVVPSVLIALGLLIGNFSLLGLGTAFLAVIWVGIVIVIFSTLLRLERLVNSCLRSLRANNAHTGSMLRIEQIAWTELNYWVGHVHNYAVEVKSEDRTWRLNAVPICAQADAIWNGTNCPAPIDIDVFLDERGKPVMCAFDGAFAYVHKSEMEYLQIEETDIELS